MSKAARLWVGAAREARVLVPPHAGPATAAAAAPRIHRSGLCQGAELAGPWLLRAAVRMPLHDSVTTSGLARRRWMGALHVRWLRRMGVTGARVYEGPPVPDCASFQARAPGDVMVGARKITSVVELRRSDEVLLAASTLLDAPPWALLCRALRRDESDAAALAAASTWAQEWLPYPVDAPASGASLRTMLHLSLHLSELGAGAFGSD